MMFRHYRVVLALLLCVALLVGCTFVTAEELEVPMDEAVDAVQDDSPVVEADGQDGGDLDADLLNPGLELNALAVGESLESTDVAVDDGEITKAQESGAVFVANTDDPDYFTTFEKDGLEYCYYPYNNELKCVNFAFDNTMDLEEQIHNFPSKLIVPAEVEMTFSRGDPSHIELYTQIVPVISIGSGFGGSLKEGDQWYVKNLSEVILPDTITSMDTGAFMCNSIKSFTFPPLIKELPHSVLENCTELTSVSFGNKVSEFGGRAFYGCVSLKDITIPNTVTILKAQVFENCTSLKRIAFGEGLTQIGDECFQSCQGLKAVDIPSNVKSIGRNAFFACESLTVVNIPDGVESIGSYAFACSKDMKRVYIPDSVKTIGDRAFGYHGWCETPTHHKQEKLADFTIYGKKGSAAEAYAKKNGFGFIVCSKAPVFKPKLLNSVIMGKGESINSIMAENSPLAAKECTFKSSNNAVVKVNSRGKLTALKPGSATITAKARDYGTTAKLKVTVKKAPGKVTVTPTKKTLKVGKTLQLKVKVPSGTASYAMKYTSNKPKIARVSKSGKVKALKEGEAVITVKAFNGKTAKVKITVVKK